MPTFCAYNFPAVVLTVGKIFSKVNFTVMLYSKFSNDPTFSEYPPAVPQGVTTWSPQAGLL